jgi:two-component system OmpR family response regulator
MSAPHSSQTCSSQHTASPAEVKPSPRLGAVPSDASMTSSLHPNHAPNVQQPFSERADTDSMSDGPKILIVDDEPNIRDLLTTSLRFAGFAVRAVGNGAQAISAVLEEEPDLIILDVMLPDMNGFGVTKRLRASGYTAPILFLTAKDDTEDKITGLTVGGDDYVTKPFSLDEIVARIKAILRRTMQDEEDAVIRAGDLTMDQDTHEVTIGDTQVELSPTEFKLLRYLMLNPNRVLSKAQILDHVWEYDFNGDAGIVESYISYLRRKLDQFSDEPVIQTKRGFGYMLKATKA